MKFENTEVWGFEHAIRGMRNPMNSWDKSDSKYCKDCTLENIDLCPELEMNYRCYCYGFNPDRYVIGTHDLELMQKLIKAGSEHRKFLRQIFVSVDITAPLYYFKELDTYKVGTVANSTSTMHKLASTPITLDCFEIDDFNKDLIIEQNTGWECPQDFKANNLALTIINKLEILRQKYLETKDKRYWKELVRWLPESWLQTRTVTMNYENILTMYRQRKNHKLNEWSGIDNPELPNFVGWVKTLPYADELILVE